MIDYAQHLIRLEKLVKEASDLCLDKEYMAAWNKALDIMTEGRLLSHTLTEMRQVEVRAEEERTARNGL